MISSLVGGYERMEHIECYILEDDERESMFVRNLVSGRAFGINNIHFNEIHDDFRYACSSRNIKFADLESFCEFWGSDIPFYFIIRENHYYEGQMCFVGDSQYEKYKGGKEIFIKYFTAFFIQRIGSLDGVNKLEQFRELIDRVVKLNWDCNEVVGLRDFYDFLEECLERMMNDVPKYKHTEYYSIFGKLKWYREVVGL